MPLADFLKVLDDQITPHVDPTEVLIIFSGGEVLVREDLEQAGTEVTRRGYPWGMVTNGMALTPQRLDRLMQAGLRSISISLDGFEREHNHIRGNAFELRTGPASHPTHRTGAESDLRRHHLRDRCSDSAFGGVLRLVDCRGVRHWRIFSIFPMGRARNDASLYLSDEQFRSLLEFIRRTRREGRIDVSYACEGFLGGCEAEVRDNFYQCAAGISVASIRVDGPFRDAHPFAETSIKAISIEMISGRFGSIGSNRSATANGPDKANAQTARCSVIV